MYEAPEFEYEAVRSVEEAVELLHARGEEAEIRHGLSGNLCRCTGYQNIVKAVSEAMKVMATRRVQA